MRNLTPKKQKYKCGPGYVLVENFMKPLFLNPGQLALHTRIPFATVMGIIDGYVAVDAEISVRLAGAFGTEPEYWLDLQCELDLAKAQDEVTCPERISAFNVITQA